MQNQILKLLLKVFHTKELLTELDAFCLKEWERNATEQELNYYLKINDAFFAN